MAFATLLAFCVHKGSTANAQHCIVGVIATAD
jgi:hypothetical protein